MITNILLALMLLLAGWIVLGWWIDDRADVAEFAAANPPRSAPDRVDTVRLPIHLGGAS